MKKNSIVWIAETAILLALLVVLQAVTGSLGQFVTGSAVNFVLIAAAVLGGLWSGVVVAAVSPFLAFALGIGPKFIQLVPCVAVGNIVIVVVYALVMKYIGKNRLVAWPVGIAAGALLKFGTLYLLIVQFVLPTIAELKPPQVTAMTAMFSWPQLVTALIGGVLAAVIVPPVKKALKR